MRVQSSQSNNNEGKQMKLFFWVMTLMIGAGAEGFQFDIEGPTPDYWLTGVQHRAKVILKAYPYEVCEERQQIQRVKVRAIQFKKYPDKTILVETHPVTERQIACRVLEIVFTKGDELPSLLGRWKIYINGKYEGWLHLNPIGDPDPRGFTVGNG